jgi:hypothetical protein
MLNYLYRNAPTQVRIADAMRTIPPHRFAGGGRRNYL